MRSDPITPAQLDFIRALVRQGIVAYDLVQREAADRWGRPTLEQIDRGQASELIEWLQAIRDGHAPRPVPPGQLTMFGGVA